MSFNVWLYNFIMGSHSYFQEYGRCCNFSSGPSAIPNEVMASISDQIMDWQGQGASVMELNHRSEAFMEMAYQSEQDLRLLLEIPDNYRVLFLAGGARGQFAAIPLNLIADSKEADYVNSGYWAKTAMGEARKYLKIQSVAEYVENNNPLDSPGNWNLNPEAAYLHYTTNETIEGRQFNFIPESGKVPLVADMSSDILSFPVDVKKFGVIYASAQKNIGPAGLTLVIVREDLLDRAHSYCPSFIHYKTQVKHQSMYNTPPVFSWYIAGLVFQWIKDQGGVRVIEARNRRKSTKLYQCIDQSLFYCNHVTMNWRSKMNVTFTIKDNSLHELFIRESEKVGLCYLRGHKALGGIRVALYNSIPEKYVEYLIVFMKEFERKYG